MSDFITHYELDLDNDDFDFEIIEIGEDYYDQFSPFQPRQITKVRVNNHTFEMKTQITDAQSFLSGWGYNQKTIDEVKQNQINDIKFTAILKYVNSPNYLRKRKLEKINKNCGN